MQQNFYRSMQENFWYNHDLLFCVTTFLQKYIWIVKVTKMVGKYSKELLEFNCFSGITLYFMPLCKIINWYLFVSSLSHWVHNMENNPDFRNLLAAPPSNPQGIFNLNIQETEDTEAITTKGFFFIFSSRFI